MESLALVLAAGLRRGLVLKPYQPFALTALQGFICGVYADSPFRAMLSEFLAKSAYLGCGFCLFNGQYEGNAMRWGGYAFKKPQVMGPNSEPVVLEMFSYDPRCRLSHAKMVRPCASLWAISHLWATLRTSAFSIFHMCRVQLERGKQVEEGLVHPSNVGCNGLCPLVAGLSYVDYKFMWRLPLAHTGLSGVLADFFDLIIDFGKVKEEDRPWFGLPLAARRLIEVSTADAGGQAGRWAGRCKTSVPLYHMLASL